MLEQCHGQQAAVWRLHGIPLPHKSPFFPLSSPISTCPFPHSIYMCFFVFLHICISSPPVCPSCLISACLALAPSIDFSTFPFTNKLSGWSVSQHQQSLNLNIPRLLMPPTESTYLSLIKKKTNVQTPTRMR